MHHQLTSSDLIQLQYVGGLWYLMSGAEATIRHLVNEANIERLAGLATRISLCFYCYYITANIHCFFSKPATLPASAFMMVGFDTAPFSCFFLCLFWL